MCHHTADILLIESPPQQPYSKIPKYILKIQNISMSQKVQVSLGYGIQMFQVFYTSQMHKVEPPIFSKLYHQKSSMKLEGAPAGCHKEA